MPPMERDKHEEILNELLNTETTLDRRTELLQSLRVDYNGVLTDFQSISETNDKLQKDNDALVVSNSKLFRQAGIIGDDKMEKQEEQKNFSETITLEQLEKR